MLAQPSRRALRLAAGVTVLILLGLAPAGCKLNDANKAAAVPKSCPDGAELKGAPPPDGTEIWCEKDVGGVPVKDGAFVVYNLSGARMIEGNYHDGKREGVWHRWDPNGFKQWTDVYKDNEKVSGELSDGPKMKVQ